jgi:glyoxylase-like metal-dependent hydrolase (beta-lactamase superfamily II)
MNPQNAYAVVLTKLLQDMVKISSHVHSIDGLDHPIPAVGIVPYLIEEQPDDLTLIDTCFASELPKLKTYVADSGFEIKNVKRIILTHVHPDHIEAANEIKKLTGAKIFSYWSEAAYLAQNPKYEGPPSHDGYLSLLQKFGVNMEDIIKKFGPMHLEPIIVDEQLNDNDTIVGTNLQVIHTPGHTPGHISLFHRKYGIVFGADFLFNSVFGIEGLFIPPSVVSIDPLTALISAQRVSRIKFDKLLLAHQSRPILEGGQKAVEKVVTNNLKK